LDAHARDSASQRELPVLSSAIRKIAGLLVAADDGYDSQVKAQDLLYGHNYAESSGGSIWYYDGRAPDGGGPPTPSDAEAATLAKLNETQAILDATGRELDLTRWSLFAEWWRLVSDPLAHFDNDTKALQALHDKYEVTVSNLKTDIDKLVQRQNDALQLTNPSTQPFPFKKAAKSPFHIRKDPTVCIAGMSSGWPANFSDPVTVRMESQLVAGPSTLSSKVPKDLGDLQTIAAKVLAEFLVPPESGSTTRPGCKVWNDIQPWCP
jgi:hypothetical protein